MGVDTRKADQNVRGSISLPNGTGKSVRVAVFAEGAKAEEAKSAGADIVGSDDLIAEIQQGTINFDAVIATPNLMNKVGRPNRLSVFWKTMVKSLLSSAMYTRWWMHPSNDT